MAEAPTNFDRYLAALWPDRYRCLGVRLLPLRVGHVLLLRRLRSPFLGDSATPPDAADIALAIAICTRPVRDAVRLVGTWSLPLRIAWLGFRAGLRRNQAALQLAAYLLEGMRGPRFWHSARGGKAMRTPYWLAVLTTLRRDLGLGADEALETPAARALWECAAIWEANDAAELVSDAEHNAMAAAAELATPALHRN